MTDFVRFERDGAIVTLTLNRPEERNALSTQAQWDELVDCCAKVRTDESIKVLILTGAGTAFSAGGNVKDLSLIHISRVAVVHDGALSWRRVEVERDLGDRLVISTGLAEGEVVVAAPSDRLVEGMRIRAKEAKSPESRIVEQDHTEPG